MQLSVRVTGQEFARARLAQVGRSVDPVMRGALNTTATQSRAQRYIKPISVALAAPRLRRSIRIKRANTRRMNARVIPSSSGVPVVHYRSWGFDPIDKTRARIWVRGPNGRKVAAGFVNPASAGKLPWSTRSSKAGKGGRNYTYKRSLQLAQGPSTAYWFKQFSGAETVRWVNTFLQQEFEKRIRREVARFGG